MKVLRFTVGFHWLASVNVRLAPSGKRLRLSSAYRKAKENTHLALLAQRPRGVRPTTGVKWALLITLRYPNDSHGESRDGDNYIKIIQDALQGVLYSDDNAVAFRDVAEPGLVERGDGEAEVIAIPMTGDGWQERLADELSSQVAALRT